jgi:hypothetical protein
MQVPEPQVSAAGVPPVARRLERVLALAAASRHRSLAARLLPLGFEALLAADPEEARRALARSDRPVRAALVESRIAALHAGSLAALRSEAALRVVVTGPPAGEAERAALRAAELRSALWEPFEESDLRWALNEALGDDPSESRGEPRVPSSLGVRCRCGNGVKAAILYNVSAGGAYVETPRPTPVGGQLDIEIALPSGLAKGRASVVSTNVPGNLRRPRLPIGMGVRFDALDADSQERLEAYVRERLSHLQV